MCRPWKTIFQLTQDRVIYNDLKSTIIKNLFKQQKLMDIKR
jgi:hypothetical protein